MIDGVFSGYQLAWQHRRQLLPVVLVVLVPMQLALFALQLTSAGPDASIINGSFIMAGPATWPQLAVLVMCWLLCVAAGASIVIGGMRGTAVSPWKALRQALLQLPVLVLSTIVAMVMTTVTLLLAGSVIGSLPEYINVIGLAALFAGVGLLLARLMFVLVTGAFGGSAWKLTRGRVLATAGAFLAGGVALPLLLAYFSGKVRTETSVPVVADFADAVLLFLVVMGQAGILANGYLCSLSDLDAVDAKLRTMAGKPRRWQVIGLAALIPALVISGTAWANPYQVAPAQARNDGPPGGPIAAAWPSGQHPIIVNNGGSVRFCNDDLCGSYVVRSGGPTVMDGWGTAGIGPDGTVVKASLTGGEDNGGPFIHYGVCTRAAECQEAWLPARASSDEKFGWSQLAVTTTADGAILFALATAVTQEIKLIRCANIKCVAPQRFKVGKVNATSNESEWMGRPGKLTVDHLGRPIATFHIGFTSYSATCDPGTCGNPRITQFDDPNPGPLLARVRAQSRSVGYVLEAERSVFPPAGFRITIGKKPEYWRYVLRRCQELACERIPLDLVEGPLGRVAIVVSAQGRVLVVREDRLILI